MTRVIATPRFAKSALRITSKDKRIKKKLEATLRQIQSDINHPSLRLHKIRSKEIWSFSVTISLRILAHFDKDIIILTDIGTHEDVY